MIKVLVADDHALVREGVKQILGQTPDMIVASEAETGQQVLDKIRSTKFDVIVLDLSMPGSPAFEILSQIKRDEPSLPVLVLSMHPEQIYGIRALKTGASGYLTKEAAPDHLITALRKVTAGGKYISPTLAEQLAGGLAAAEKPTHELLSDREYAVLCQIAAGCSIKEIAEDLSLSVKTISAYRSRILQKTKLRTNAEMVRFAIEYDLLE